MISTLAEKIRCYMSRNPELIPLMVASYALEIEESENISTETNRLENRPQVMVKDREVVMKLPKQMPLNEAIAVFLHELFHFLLDHFRRAELAGVKSNIEHLLWNIAADHVINDQYLVPLMEDKIIPPCEHIKNGRLKDYIGVNISVERLYRIMANQVIPQLLKKGCAEFCGVRFEVVDDPNQADTTFDIVVDGEQQINASDANAVDKACSQAKSRYKYARQQQKMMNKKMRGRGTGNILEKIDIEMGREVDWKKAIDHFIKLLKPSYNPTWVSKRRYGEFYLPAYSRPELRGTKVICLVDTSGSMSTNELRMIFNNLATLSESVEEIIIIQHDEKIKKIHKFEKDDQVEVLGRGGTSHKDTFDLIEKMYKGGEKICGVVIMSDFYSDVDNIYHKYKWIKDIPICAITFGMNNLKFFNLPNVRLVDLS